MANAVPLHFRNRLKARVCDFVAHMFPLNDLRRYCARRPFLQSKFVKVVTKDGAYLLENMIKVALELWRRYPAG